MAVLLSSLSLALAQAPQSFSYQAVLRSPNGEVMANKDVTLRISLRKGAPDSEPAVYNETHEVRTTASGVVAIAVGEGQGASSKFSDVTWNEGIFMQTEVSEGGGEFTNLGTTQILAVPYALYAQNAARADVATTAEKAVRAAELSSSNPVVITASKEHPKDAPIFTVRNSNGDVMFEVYEDGVHTYVNAAGTTRSSRGGFVVSTLGQPDAKLLSVTPDSTRIYISGETQRGTRGGFAVAGFDSRADGHSYLSVTPEATEVQFDAQAQARGTRGGFAVAGFDSRATSTTEYLSVTPELTQITVGEPQTRGTRGGFAVAGFDSRAANAAILHVSPDSTRIYINDNSRGSRGSFAIAGRDARGLRASGRNYLEITNTNANITFGSTSTGQADLGSFVVGDMQGNDYMVVNHEKATFSQLYSKGNLMVGDNGGRSMSTTHIGTTTWHAADYQSAKFRNGNDLVAETHYLAGGPYVFYFWEAVKDDQLCPDGWHIATKQDWVNLFTGLGATGTADGTGVTRYNADGFVEKLLDPRGAWVDAEGSSQPTAKELTNATGFSVFPGVVVSDDPKTMQISKHAAKYWALDNGQPVMVTFSTERASTHEVGSPTLLNANPGTTQVGTVRCVKNN